MNLLDSELWPVVAVVAVLLVALVARWLRSSAVEDPERLGDAEVDADVLLTAADEAKYDDEADVGDEELDDEDEVAPLGVSPDDRLEFLERLAESGAVALLWTPPDGKESSRVVQHDDKEGNSTLPVFTSEPKALGYVRALGPEAIAKAQCFEPWAVDAAFLVQGDFRVLVNAATDFETELTAEDRRALAGLAGVEEREASDFRIADDEEAKLAADEEAQLADDEAHRADEDIERAGHAESDPPLPYPMFGEPPRVRRPR
jgi:hypothetical protein